MESLFSHLVDRYPDNYLAEVIHAYLHDRPHTFKRIEDFYLDFPSHCQQYSIESPALVDEASCTLNLHHYMHFEADLQGTEVASFENFECLYLAKGVFYQCPEAQEADLFGVATNKVRHKKNVGIACHKTTPNFPVYLEIEAPYQPIMNSLKEGLSFLESMENLDEAINPNDFGGFCAGLSSFLTT